MNQREAVKILKKAGFEQTKGGKGSHIKMQKGNLTTTIPHGELKKGTMSKIEKDTQVKLK